MSRLRFYDRPTRPPSIIAAVGTVLIASLLMTAPAIAAGTPATVAVSSVTELEAAITDEPLADMGVTVLAAVEFVLAVVQMQTADGRQPDFGLDLGHHGLIALVTA